MKALPHSPSMIESVCPSRKLPATVGDDARTFIRAKSPTLHGIGTSGPAGGRGSLGILVVYGGTNRRRPTRWFLRVGPQADVGLRGGSG
jgi:hypothetical protein